MLHGVPLVVGPSNSCSSRSMNRQIISFTSGSYSCSADSEYMPPTSRFFSECFLSSWSAKMLGLGRPLLLDTNAP
jgi:hypothetical protein